MNRQLRNLLLVCISALLVLTHVHTAAVSKHMARHEIGRAQHVFRQTSGRRSSPRIIAGVRTASVAFSHQHAEGIISPALAPPLLSSHSEARSARAPPLS